MHSIKSPALPNNTYMALLNSHLGEKIASDFVKKIRASREPLSNPLDVYYCSTCFTTVFVPYTLYKRLTES